jgi:hypothetical protein
MSEPIIYDQHLKDEYFQLVWLHTSLQYDSPPPTTYPEMIETALDRDFINLERDLLKHPLTNIHMHFAMLTRVAWAEAVLYSLADLDVKRKTQLRWRKTFEAVQLWPKAWQEAMAPIFAHWAQVLNDEAEFFDA